MFNEIGRTFVAAGLVLSSGCISPQREVDCYETLGVYRGPVSGRVVEIDVSNQCGPKGYTPLPPDCPSTYSRMINPAIRYFEIAKLEPGGCRLESVPDQGVLQLRRPEKILNGEH